MAINVLAWNAHAFDTSQARRVTRALDTWVGADVQVIVLTEVKGARNELRAWARRNGFKHYQEPTRGTRADEHGETAVLLRLKGSHAVKPVRQWVKIMTRPWTVFEYRVLHNPRRYVRVVFRLPDGAKVRLSGEHWPTRGNRKAQEEAYLSARAFLERPGPRLVVGDLNIDRNGAANLADDVGGPVAGHGVDWCIGNRPKARITATELVGGGSDHKALLYEVTD